MKNICKKISILITVSIILTGCAAYNTSQYSRINLLKINIGMTKNEVIEALGKTPDNLIAAQQYPEGTIEVLQYSRYGGPAGVHVEERYWLYFYNDSLQKWGRPGDWNEEADKVYEVRYR